MSKDFLGRLEQTNQELLLVFSLFVIALMMNYLRASQRMVLSFYALPDIDRM